MAYVQILAGFILLLGGSTMLVSGAVAVAQRFRVSPMVIGLTLVGFGTSTPELSASLGAALLGSSGIAVGNVVGSNIANILLILGLAALLRPIPVDAKAFRRDGLVLLAATLLLMALGWLGMVERWLGLAMVAALVLYTVHAIRAERRAARSDSVYVHEAAVAPLPQRNLALAGAAAVAGLAALIGGADLLVEGAVVLARAWGVSESVIGLTIVAVGTSLPELATSIVAAWRGETDVAFGNVVGSNIYNALGILGATALVHPIAYPADIAQLDNWLMLATTLLLLVFARSRLTISRWEGGVFLAAYLVYVAAMALR
ncbi:MAG: calcium/sodium antiporter [Pseudomonadota bacterium]